MHVLGWWMGYNQVGWFILNGIKLHENCWSCTQKQMENIPSYSWFVPCQLWKGFGESGSELLAAGYLLFVAIVFNGFPPDDARLICPIVPRWSLPPFPEKKNGCCRRLFFPLSSTEFQFAQTVWKSMSHTALHLVFWSAAFLDLRTGRVLQNFTVSTEFRLEKLGFGLERLGATKVERRFERCGWIHDRFAVNRRKLFSLADSS